MPASNYNGTPSAARQLWEGITRPSLLAVAGTLLLVVLQMAAIAWYCTPERMATMDRELLLESPFDYDSWVTMTAHRLQHQTYAGLDVLFLTSSSGRHSIQSVDALSQQISNLVGEPVRFEMLATGAQTLWETEILLDQISSNFRGLVIISTSVSHLSWRPEDLRKLARNPRLGLDSESYSRRLLAAGINTRKQLGIYFLDHAHFFASRRRALLKNALLGPPEYDPHRWPDGELASEKEWMAIIPRYMKRMQRFEENHVANLLVLSDMIDRLQKRGIQVALHQLPRHPRLLQLYGGDYKSYQNAIESFASAQKVALWRLDDTVALQHSEFRDWSHLTDPAARERYQHELGRRIAVSLNSRKEGDKK